MAFRPLLALVLVLLLAGPASAQSGDAPVPVAPAYPVAPEISTLLAIAAGELAYSEQPDGSTKYGIWAGDARAEWCAEYLCWAVDQTDQKLGTHLLRERYPFYTSNNTGRDWFLTQGRYIARSGFVTDWGTQWYKGASLSMEKNSYIPQPGDWVFFSYGAAGDTSHVAMVEGCLQAQDGRIILQVLEGNNPKAVARAQYDLKDWRIQGYGTVRDLADIVLRMGAKGEKVRQLQQTLVDIGLLGGEGATGIYNQKTSDAVKAFQYEVGMPTTGIANQATQLNLEEHLARCKAERTEFWIVDPGL
ncbi:MAG: peptidoglycan-binding protein [Christensenellales bacterium]